MRATLLSAVAISIAACGDADDAAGRADSFEGPPARAEDFAALGYAGWDEDDDHADESDVVTHDRDRVMPCPRAFADDRSRVLVVDPNGELARVLVVPGRNQVEFARFLPGGRVACLSVDEGLTLLEADGSVVWHLDIACHHDVSLVPDGREPGARLLALATHREHEWRGRRVRFDEVVFVDESTGRISESTAPWSTFEAREALRERSGRPHALDRPPSADAPSRAKVYDYFHLNAVSFDGPSRMIVCLRNVDLIVAIDLETRTLGDSVGPGILDWPHAPIAVGPPDARTLLIFDNGKHRGWSRAIEVELETGRTAWQYGGRPSEPLFSELRGYAQRLPNGNTLITESERGRVLEVTRDGELVWEFWNPETRATATGTARRRIYRMTAIDPEAAAEAVLAPTKRGR